MMENLQITVLTVGQMVTNCYLLYDPDTLSTLIIDPGDDAEYIIRKLKDMSLRPVFLAATHGHFDHIMAALELQLAFDIPFYINKKDIFLMKNMQQSARHFLGILQVDPPPQISGFLTDKKNLNVGNEKIEILETPGHTPGSVCLYQEKSKSLFGGDLLFAGGGVGRTDFSYSSSDFLQKSLYSILSLPDDTTIFPGHGPSFILSQYKNNHW
ncbi:MAG: MBL fold metallo-hydrolase [Patescibacteria group bacterium]|nr:MBL fold metallo-hydrolase [Patescibacteria group bacterium]